jgi:protoporphyrin/coproporphyrin ferrochelatase
MNKFSASESFSHGQSTRTAVLLVQLGTPDEPTPTALRRYLREFLSDPRVVEIPALVWKLILYGIILNVRPRKSAAKYAAIWTKDGSPLRVNSVKQTKLLKGWIGEQGHDVDVVLAMRYGQPSVPSVLRQLREKGMDRLLILPMYPQYAAATSATALDAVFRELSLWRNQPEIRTIKHFHDDPNYIDALAAHVNKHWERDGRPEHFVMTFHGVPRRSLTLGDPYHCECLKTGRLLGERLGLSKDQYSLSFQSRFGRAEWLQPYTTTVLTEVAKKIKGRVDVFCPGFVVDCLETLEEIALEGQEDYHAAGGGEYKYIPCINDDGNFIASLGQLALRHMQAWPTERLSPAQTKVQSADLSAQKQAAIALGSSK